MSNVIFLSIFIEKCTSEKEEWKRVQKKIKNTTKIHLNSFTATVRYFVDN